MRQVKSHISFLILISFNLLLTHLKLSLQDVRLPTHLTPEKYNLIIFSKLDSETPTFWGDVRITVTCNEDTNMITLHVKDLDITENEVEINLEGSESTSFVVINRNYNPESYQYTMTLDAYFKKDSRYEIFIPFEGGHFSSESSGYSLVTRTYKKGSSVQKKIFATTNLGISDAKRVFPCFDQMDMPAEFTISLAHPQTFISFSNMNRVGYETVSRFETWVKDRFAKSPKIPPSAVAIALIPADFELKDLPQDSKTPLRIWAQKSEIRRPEFPREAVTKAFSYLAEYFTVPYPFPKLNVILYANYEINQDDYGIIVVGRSCVINPSYSSIGLNQFEKALDICHLMSHQWIGTYAPMSRKNEYWLHEALALHFDVLCANKVSSSWQNTFSDIHIVDTFLLALKYDQDGLTDKLNIAENDSHMTAKLVDVGHLIKAQYLIRMMSFFLGEAVFQLGIVNYFQEFALTNSNVDKVWATFSKTAIKSEVQLQGLTVEEIMNLWISQKGYPLIIVTIEREKNRVLIEQKRFKLLDELNEKYPKPNRGIECWPIPLSYMRKGELESEVATVRKWITCEGPATLDISLDEDEWILVNLNLNVLSRTSYDEENWGLLLKTLNSDDSIKINVMTRVKLVSDAFEMSKVGLLTYKMLFEIIKYLIYENHFLLWNLASEELENILILLSETEVYDLYKAHIKKTLNSVFQKIDITFSRSDYLKNKLKRTILQFTCNFDFDGCHQLSTILFNDWIESTESNNPNKKNSIPRYIRSIVCCQAVKGLESEKEWNFLWKKYNKDDPDRLNDIILDALGCSSNSQTLKKYLEWSLNKKEVLLLDNFKIFRSLSKNKIGYRLMKDFFVQHFDTIYELNREVNLFIDSYFISLFDITTKETDLHQLLQLAIEHQQKLGNFQKIYNHHVNVASRNVLWIKTHKDTLLDLLLK